MSFLPYPAYKDSGTEWLGASRIIGYKPVSSMLLRSIWGSLRVQMTAILMELVFPFSRGMESLG